MAENLPETIRLVKGDDGVFRADSRDVAEDFGKRHANVLRDIENLQVSDPEAELNFELCYYQVNGGRKYPYYRMDKDGFALLAMGFTGPEAAVWKRLYIKSFNAMREELERRQEPVALSRKEILIMALEAEDRAEKAESEVAELKPDAESMRLLRSAEGSITMTAMAKMLEVKRPWLFDLLTECGWFYTQNGAHLPYAPLMKQGYLTVDPGKGKPIMRSSGAVEVKVTTLITAKGISKITEIVKGALTREAAIKWEGDKKNRDRMSKMIDGDNGYRQSDEEIYNEMRHDDAVYGSGDD